MSLSRLSWHGYKFMRNFGLFKGAGFSLHPSSTRLTLWSDFHLSITILLSHSTELSDKWNSEMFNWAGESWPPNKTPLSGADSVQPAAISALRVFSAHAKQTTEVWHAIVSVPKSWRLYNYLLMYYYSCCLFIFTVFIQPGRVPPKTHDGQVGMEEMVRQGWTSVCVCFCTQYPLTTPWAHLVVSEIK